MDISKSAGDYSLNTIRARQTVEQIGKICLIQLQVTNTKVDGPQNAIYS